MADRRRRRREVHGGSDRRGFLRRCCHPNVGESPAGRRICGKSFDHGALLRRSPGGLPRGDAARRPLGPDRASPLRASRASASARISELKYSCCRMTAASCTRIRCTNDCGYGSPRNRASSTMRLVTKKRLGSSHAWITRSRCTTFSNMPLFARVLATISSRPSHRVFGIPAGANGSSFTPFGCHRAMRSSGLSRFDVKNACTTARLRSRSAESSPAALIALPRPPAPAAPPPCARRARPPRHSSTWGSSRSRSGSRRFRRRSVP